MEGGFFTQFNYKFGCSGCHQANGKGGIVCPDLSQAEKRLKPAWVIEWVKDAQSLDKHAPVPSNEMSIKDAKALASYIMSLNGKEVMEKGQDIEEIGNLAKKGNN